MKRAAELRPGGTLGTIPWLIARPYAGTRLTLERMDRNVWARREEVARTIEQSDFLLFPEYWLLEDREIDKLVDARFPLDRAYEDGVVLYQSRRLEEPNRRRPRSEPRPGPDRQPALSQTLQPDYSRRPCAPIVAFEIDSSATGSSLP